MGDKFRELATLLKNNDWDGVFKRPTGNIVIQFVRNPLAGIVAFAVDYLLLYILTDCGLQYLVSAAIAFITGTTVNYFLCRVIVFNAYIPRYKSMPEYTIFIIIGVIGLGLTELLMYLFTDAIGFHYLLSKVVAGILVSLWNFFGRRFFLFNNY
ncbi:MAG TPA: GtrA family protein [Spirochaetota bacterium]|nr:GtrA family protein [Spirochaetota bacterium]HOD16173.1 GtrA family protein [Spirochaetota bacterium]HOZ62698.1 GtrA family protein [Smithellaceae bacterium]HPN13086.1 GtrA family protein [Spirochaetota bacterium]HQL83079.1 GtrA family protein [Spirochaetota bacterium]